MMEARKHTTANPFQEAIEKFKELRSSMASKETMELTHSEVEGLLATEGRELLRRLFQSHLELRGLQERRATRVVGRDEQPRTHRRLRKRTLASLFGTVNVARLAFSGRGVSSLMPLDAELNLPKRRYSFGLQRRLVEEVIRGSFDDAVEAVDRTVGVRVPKRQAEELVRSAARDFDVFYAADGGQLGADAPEPTDLLVMTCDGKGIVMRHDDLREATRRAAEAKSHKLSKRLSKGEKRNRRRMAEVASVYSIAPHVRSPEDIVRSLRPVRDVDAPKPPRPRHKRVWASVAKDAEQVIAEMFEEALRRDPDRQMRWVAVVDGNETQLRLLQAYAKECGVKLTIVLDVIHVLEYLWKATIAVHGEGNPITERIVADRLVKVLGGHASEVAAGIKQSGTKRGLKGRRRKRLRTAANYLLKHAQFLRYDKYLADGLPIASGVIEGACRYLVKDRMDITGARWGLDTAEAVLKLRALKASGDFDLYWAFHERQQWDRTHAAKYDGRKPPSTTDQARANTPHLSLVPDPS